LRRLLTTMPANKLLKTVAKLVTTAVKAINELASQLKHFLVPQGRWVLSPVSRLRMGFIAVDYTVGVTNS